MVIEEALVQELLDDSTVAGLIATRMYPYVVPQDAALPAVAYQRISGPREYSHDGASGLARGLFQITCEGTSYSQAKALAAAVRGALSGFAGLMGGVGGVTVGGAWVENEVDGYGESAETRVVRLDVMVQYAE